MSVPVKLTEVALADLDDIWLFIAREDVEAADRFIDQLLGRISNLGDQPHMGRQRDDLRPGLRSFPVRRYLILYEVGHDAVYVLRVVRGERNLPALF